jgi:hypothetical protein
MKLRYMNVSIIAALIYTSMLHIDVSAQAFRKGSLLVSASEGATFSRYTTTGTDAYNQVIASDNINGDRDPLTIEYGLSNKWGISLTSGGDIYRVNAAKFYGDNAATVKVKAITGEMTVDANYHFYVTKRVDISGFASVGLAGMSIKGNDGDHAYDYSAGGTIVRLGGRARYYVFKRVGIMGMFSGFSTSLSPDGGKNITMGQGVHTAIQGCALEFGLCYRVLR